MTDIQVFAFFVLPAFIVLVGGLITLLELRAQRAAHPAEPDLFDRAPAPHKTAR